MSFCRAPRPIPHCWKGTSFLSRDLMRRSTRSPIVRRLVADKPGRPDTPPRQAIFVPPQGEPGAGANARRHAQLFVLAFVVLILMGTVLLATPWVTTAREPTPVIDAFFTAVSASSVTGLVVVDTLEHWNWTGQLIVLTLIRIGVFYAISAFCNAGFDLGGGFVSLQPAASNVWVNLVFMALIQAGALSYIIFADVARQRSWRSLALDTKIVLALNAVLLVGGALVFLAAEWGGSLAGHTIGSKALAALFQSVAARTAGFTTVDWNLAHPLTLFFWLGLMFIGGASGSTAGGVRLNTVGVVVAAVLSTLRGNPETQVWGRRIATPLVFRAVTVIAISLLLYGAVTALLSTAEHHIGHRETGMTHLMFESMSALATVGVSTGITPALTAAGKIILCAAMFVGRLGPLTAVYALQRHQRPERYRFPEEAVRIG